ncbi:MAG: leucine--tRNA ligase [Planctomycetota bacterium]|jgi:leucyl-tRNA synthetase
MSSPTSAPGPAETTAAHDRERPFRYTARLADEIERRWQATWLERGTFEVPGPGDDGFDAGRPKYFCLDMFPYPSGAGLHVGHPEGYTATDIMSRYRRHRGHNVLHPMGFDAFGLPAEQYAIETGVHPSITTRQAMENFRRQLQRFGFCYDWSRELATIDEGYYRWTQWIWLRSYHAWFDADAGRARPIDELSDDFAAGRRPVRCDPEAPAGAVPEDLRDRVFESWSALDRRTRKRILDSYRLTYVSTQTVNWCPKLGTALANEEVIDGKSERGGHPVFRRPLRQWMYRITAYAERLLDGLDGLEWPESTTAMQSEWIGRSEGAEIDFPLVDPPAGAPGSLRVFTTRPDTVFGATYMVLAPEHPVVDAVLADPRPETDADAVRAYVDAARGRSDVDRMADTKEKTGVFTGAFATNPASGERIPIWIADYVLMGYGHGAIMAVPAHDVRDAAFAIAFGLPIPEVVLSPAGHEPTKDELAVAFEEDGRTRVPFAGAGTAVNSANEAVSLDGRPTAEAKRVIIDWLESSGRGRRRVNYKLRDWLFSRQRYWGEPIPVVFDREGDHWPVAPDRLPVVLPELADYRPVESEEPAAMLAKATGWVRTTAGEAGVAADDLPADTTVARELNTMPGWAGSCWYYLRFCAPHDEDRFTTEAAERYWMDGGGVDLYIGGSEHAVLHLLYARFWHMILHDLGDVSTPEPFERLFHQGLIMSFAYQRADRSLVPTDAVENRGTEEHPEYVETATGQPVTQIVAKMSKSLKNVVNPDDVIAEYGADTFRLYEMYMGPLDQGKPWNPRDIVGCHRFLQRAWRLVVDERTGELACIDAADDGVERQLHRTIARVGQDIERLAFNTAIAALIELVNAATAAGGLTRDQLARFTVLLSPFAPHMAEELWAKRGETASVCDAAWPACDEAMLREDEIELPVQVMGKVRGRVTVAADATAETIEAAALAEPQIAALLEGKTIRKVVVVPGKIVNIVAG